MKFDGTQSSPEAPQEASLDSFSEAVLDSKTNL